MKKVFYEKVGRRYKPVYEYDQVLMDALPKGTHMIQVYPGGKSTRYNIDPNYAAMIAAGRVAEDSISLAIMKASDIRRQTKGGCTKLTPGQHAAWENLVKEFGEEARQLEWPSAREAAEKAVEAMIGEAELLLTNPTVRNAYEHFMLVCELTKKHNDASN